MNKKGFAISIVLYSIIIMIITILYVMLGIEKNRYDTNMELRDKIIEELNEAE